MTGVQTCALPICEIVTVVLPEPFDPAIISSTGFKRIVPFQYEVVLTIRSVLLQFVLASDANAIRPLRQDVRTHSASILVIVRQSVQNRGQPN